MLDRVLRFFIILLAAIAGGALLNLATPFLTFFISTEVLETEMGFFKLSIAGFLSILFGAVAGAAVGFLLSPFFIRKIKGFAVFVEAQLNKMPTHDVIAGAIGLLIGLIIANLLGYAFSKIPVVGEYIPVVFSIVLGYLGIHIMIKKRQELVSIFDFIPKFMKELVKMRETKRLRLCLLQQRINLATNCWIPASSLTAVSRIFARRVFWKARS